jgi:hypothetical protein
MRPSLMTASIAGVLLFGVFTGLVLNTRAIAQDQAPPARSSRGGLLAKSQRHQFEVFFYPTGIRLFPQTLTGKPLDTTHISAMAIFYHPNSPRPWFDRRLEPTAMSAGEAPSSLDDSIGLEQVPASGVKVVFEMSGLSDPAESAASITVPFELVSSPLPAPSTAPTAVSSPSPRFVYGSGYQGIGYYANPGPQSVPQPAAVLAASPPRYSGGNLTQSRSSARSVGPGARDWSTGRNNRLHKPWLRSMD